MGCGFGCVFRKMGVRKGAFWTVLGGAICPIIRKVLVGRDLEFVDKCAFWGANYGRELVSCCWVGAWGGLMKTPEYRKIGVDE